MIYINFPSDGVKENPLDIAMKPLNDDSFYAYNNDSYFPPFNLFVNDKFRINEGKVDVKVELIGQRDAATAKPQSFVIGDGWFIYNLITNLANL